MSTLAIISGRQLADGDGVPYAGAKAYFYGTDGSTAISTYSDADVTTPNSNPVVADADGWFEPIYLADTVTSYRVIIRSTHDTLLRDWEGIPTGVTQEQVGTVLYPRSAAEIAAGITPTNYSYEVGNVMRYGATILADETGTTDSASAFNTAWQAIKTTGGRLTVPPGNYYLTATWLCDVDLNYGHNYEIFGYGAQIRSSSAVTGFSMKIYKGFNYFGVKVYGLQFNHRGNSTAAGAVQLMGASNAYLKDVTVEMHTNAATWRAFELAPYTTGDGNTHCFWCVIDQCSTRLRSSTDVGSPTSSYYSYAGIVLKGQANAAVIRNCRLAHVTHAVRMETDGSTQGFANGVTIHDTAFEGVTNGITIYTTPPSGYVVASRDSGTGGVAPAPNNEVAHMPTGMKVKDCRIESATTFVNITGTVCVDHSHPPIFRDNYLGIGSVTNYIVNANNQRVRIDEPSHYGATAMDNRVGGPNNYRVICEGVGKNFRISKDNDTSNYDGGHLILGGYHLWINDPGGGAGKLYMKWGVPTTDTDGTVVGTQT